MSYTLSEVRFPSSDGYNSVYARIYIPNGEIKGVVQLSHGMVDHSGRYEALAEYLTASGYVFAGNDHLGHGYTAESDMAFGFFAESGGVNYILEDLYSMNKLLCEKFPEHKPVLMGHSMGSFLSRLYAVKYPESISGHIIHGTGGPMGAVLPMGKALVKIMMTFCGKKYRSKMIKNISFMGYNDNFPESEGENAWLTRDLERVSSRDTDRLTNFIFTLSAYYDLFTMVGKCNSDQWFNEYPKDLPTIIMSGTKDPVGNDGAGPSYVYDNLQISGTKNITLKLYEEARHELFNETNREEVFCDMVQWLGGLSG